MTIPYKVIKEEDGPLLWEIVKWEQLVDSEGVG